MRNLTDHVVENDSVNHQLQIEVQDEPGAGGANHDYLVMLPPGHTFLGSDDNAIHVQFQNGPIKECGLNGLTHEALLAIVIDRLRAFQAGPYACDMNAIALKFCENALECLKSRTKSRLARGVEGTHLK